MSKPRKRTIVVREAHLEKKLTELHSRGCRVVESRTVISRRRRHGLITHRVVIIIHFLDPRPARRQVPAFYPTARTP